MKGPLTARQGEPAAAGSPVEKPAVAAVRAGALSAFDMATTASEVALVELRRLLAAWRVHEPGARLGHDSEALHQLRVTARRIDATLGLFKQHLPMALSHARKTAKTVLRTLGAARDLDVQLAELARYRLALPEHERTAAEPLQARLEAERVRARTRMVRALDSQPTRRWLETLTLASAQASPANGAFADRAMLVMPERVRRRFRKLRKSVGRLRSKSSMEDYHLVRRRAKQLRYAIECGAGMFGKPADDALKALRRLQDKLGAHQDAYMARNRLAALAADPANGLAPGTLFLMGRLAEHHARTSADARKTLSQFWRKVRGKRWRALRTKLEELSDSAREANNGLAPAAEAPIAAARLEHAPELEPRPIKH
ncbi:MAG TPA: CHAD domain-containing protein [Steroidobacteraceae bacterium]